MTRKDSEKESERPHYYSQFWLDIAAGRRTIGGPRPEDGEAIEPETPEPVLQRRPGRVGDSETFSDTFSSANGHQEEVVHPVADAEEEEYSEPEEELAPEVEEPTSVEYQEDLPIEDEDIPDMDLNVEDEEEETLEEEEEEEEEDDMNWGRGRKKPKPIRPTKAPVKKPGKPRRSF